MKKAFQIVGATLAVLGGGTTFYAYPPTHSCPSQHTEITPAECSLIRRVHFSEPLKPENNPGVRAFPDLLSTQQCDTLRKEAHELAGKYGLSLISRQHAAIYAWQMSYMAAPPRVNMTRVTGRPEHPAQVLPPWGYGDKFKEECLPPAIKDLVQRVRSLPGLRLGKLRDVTINVRRDGFYRLDPHLDPKDDGENVFVFSIDAGTVLTLTPARLYKLRELYDTFLGGVTLSDEREIIKRRADISWTFADIDVWLPPGAGVLLHGDARWNWYHGTRLGIEYRSALASQRAANTPVTAQKPEPEGAEAPEWVDTSKNLPGSIKAATSTTIDSGSNNPLSRVSDWWGIRGHPLPRKDCRTSIVLAFAKAED